MLDTQLSCSFSKVVLAAGALPSTAPALTFLDIYFISVPDEGLFSVSASLLSLLTFPLRI